MTLTEFLLARIAEDEALVRVEISRRDVVLVGPFAPAHILAVCESRRRIVQLHDDEGHECIEDVGTTVRAFPVAGSMSVKGMTLAGCQTLRLLALPYADHPDYDPAWCP